MLRPSTPRAGSAIRVPSPSATTTLRSAPVSPRRPIRTAPRRPSALASLPHRSRRLRWAQMTERHCSMATATRRSRSKLGRLHSSCSSRTHVPSRSSSTHLRSSVMPQATSAPTPSMLTGRRSLRATSTTSRITPSPRKSYSPQVPRAHASASSLRRSSARVGASPSAT